MTEEIIQRMMQKQYVSSLTERKKKLLNLISLTERRKILLNLIEQECNEEKKKIYNHMLLQIQLDIKWESRVSSFLEKEWNENGSLATESIIVELDNLKRFEKEERDSHWIECLCLLFPPLIFFFIPYWIWQGYQKER